MTDATFDRLAVLARDEFDATGTIDPTSTFDALGFDSLDRLEFAMLAEDELGVAIEDSDMVGVSTMGQLAAMVERKMAE